MATIDTTREKESKEKVRNRENFSEDINISEEFIEAPRFPYSNEGLTPEEIEQLDAIARLEPLINSGRLDINARYEDEDNTLIESAIASDQALLAIFLYNNGAKVDFNSEKLKEVDNHTAQVIRFAVNKKLTG